MAENEAPADASQKRRSAPQIPGIIAPPAPDLKWAKAPTERPPRIRDLAPRASRCGWPTAAPTAGRPTTGRTRTTRRAAPSPSKDMGLPAPYTIYDKLEVWAENSADLYEAAIREQWKPATRDLLGHASSRCADHIEASLDQIFSNISEQAYNSNQVLMGWLKQISYGFHEVKLYLATQVFDHARHVEAFRKRALSNGGGLGVQSPGFFNRTVYASFKFTELVDLHEHHPHDVPARRCARSGDKHRPLAGGPAALRAARRTTCAATSRTASSTCATTCCMGGEQKRRNVAHVARPRRGDDGRRPEARQAAARGVHPRARRHRRGGQGRR